MKAHLRELTLDLKAAASIGHPETLDNALDGIRALDDGDLHPSDLPSLGQALARAATPSLTPFLQDSDPAVRGAVAAALGLRYLNENNVSPDDLLPAADDPHPDVRGALAQNLTGAGAGSASPDRLRPLALSWLTLPEPDSFPDRVHTGLQILPHAGPSPGEITELLAPLHDASDHLQRQALVDCLNTLAENSWSETVLTLLEDWTARSDPNVWVITRALSASWALNNSPSAIFILNKLVQRVGDIRPIGRALARHEPPI